MKTQEMLNGGKKRLTPKEERAEKIGAYIVKHKATVRQATEAYKKEYGISKTTVHLDITEKLERVNEDLYKQVREILDENKKERHLRGGMATKAKYLSIGKSKTMSGNI